MKELPRPKSLGDLRTAITARVHNKPSQKGMAHLDIYLLSVERQRLETELAGLEQRRKRLHQQMAKIQGAMATLQQDTERERASGEAGALPATPGRQPPDPLESTQRPWKKVALDYG